MAKDRIDEPSDGLEEMQRNAAQRDKQVKYMEEDKW